MSNKREEKYNKEMEVSYFRGSPKVLKIYNNNYYYLINHDNYDITKIMMLINNEHLSTLREQFLNYS